MVSMSMIIFIESIPKMNIDYVKRFVVNKKKPESLAEFVKRVRLEKGFSLVAVHERSGGEIAASYVSRIENGQVTNPTHKKLSALAAGLGISEDNVFAVARGQKYEDSEDFKSSRFASMALKFSKIPSGKRISVDQLIEILDRELDRLSDT